MTRISGCGGALPILKLSAKSLNTEIHGGGTEATEGRHVIAVGQVAAYVVVGIIGFYFSLNIFPSGRTHLPHNPFSADSRLAAGGEGVVEDCHAVLV